ncbi:IclR family transcriptional regulator domain-containing protein [Paludibaculum fermentans]|uniref:IclR family transcriptional regulator n=1 Tax=Paludibaculum fermentans TaxID=1473598 RepID=UPI003EC13359
MPSTQISEKRLAANRANAQKSTGPRTAAGKAKVSANARRTGAYSEDHRMSPRLEAHFRAIADARTQHLADPNVRALSYDWHILQGHLVIHESRERALFNAGLEYGLGNEDIASDWVLRQHGYIHALNRYAGWIQMRLRRTESAILSQPAGLDHLTRLFGPEPEQPHSPRLVGQHSRCEGPQPRPVGTPETGPSSSCKPIAACEQPGPAEPSTTQPAGAFEGTNPPAAEPPVIQPVAPEPTMHFEGTNPPAPELCKPPVIQPVTQAPGDVHPWPKTPEIRNEIKTPRWPGRERPPSEEPAAAAHNAPTPPQNATPAPRPPGPPSSRRSFSTLVLIWLAESVLLEGIAMAAPRPAGAESDPHYIELVGKVIQVLEALRDEPTGLPLRDLAERTGQIKSSVHRIVSSLKHHGYAEQEVAGGPYRLGLQAVTLARGAVDGISLLRVSRPMLRELADRFNESVYLAVVDGPRAIFVDVQESRRDLRLVGPLGAEVHFNATAAGKVIAAFSAPEAARDILRRLQLKLLTDKTLTDPFAIEREWSKVRRAGYARNDEETIVGAIFLAAPVFDAANSVCGSISLGIPKARYQPTLGESIAAAVKAAADRLSRALEAAGYHHGRRR